MSGHLGLAVPDGSTGQRAVLAALAGSPFGPAGPPGPRTVPVAPASFTRAFFDRSLVWIVPSLICSPVISDAATAEPDIATRRAITATVMEPDGMSVRMREFMPTARFSAGLRPMGQPDTPRTGSRQSRRQRAAARSIVVTGGQLPAAASPVTSKPCRS